ncbi:MAG: helix-hairpin-helix domain-containing protein [Deltaproteobacteria bacterium]|uniref:ComEA family DNA-binding protein n=1 Tax=Desulfobacula sp. TaxID=2593537 RepID=UPI0019C74683|nr:helix-hairpin-helix domain-containing protein [Candidatus Desulfobacula maris]MBL6996242.1 helix-hairpin-helix domain-containing protein [Desulfobacula sp.]
MKKIHKISIALFISLLFLSFCLPVMAVSGKININTATKEELVTLKGVGDIIADRIIEYRKATPFETPEDIIKVKGVAQKIFDANKELIIVKDE